MGDDDAVGVANCERVTDTDRETLGERDDVDAVEAVTLKDCEDVATEDELALRVAVNEKDGSIDTEVELVVDTVRETL